MNTHGTLPHFVPRQVVVPDPVVQLSVARDFKLATLGDILVAGFRNSPAAALHIAGDKVVV